MRLLIYEHLTATAGCGPELPPSLAIEGWAMLSALLLDCSSVPDVEPHTLLGPSIDRDVPATVHLVDPLRGWLASFVDHLQQIDVVLIIAPEFERILETLVRVAEVKGKQLLGCSSKAIALTADKLACGCYLRDHQVPTPECREFHVDQIEWASQDRIFPAVLKPRDGAGSLGTILVSDEQALERAFASVQGENPSANWILQSFFPGQPASVSCIVHDGGVLALPAATQQLSNDGRFRYLGGQFPLQEELQQRAQRIARDTVGSIERLRGYVGVDLILGPSADGRDDCVIEINPRITTSYLALRSLCQQNLLEIILNACTGKEIVPLSWKSGNVRFQPDGTVSQQ
jgi:predicted ATP-grasp superfamily ATP-dependent carboligase